MNFLTEAAPIPVDPPVMNIVFIINYKFTANLQHPL